MSLLKKWGGHKMGKNDEYLEESASIVEKIENQLEEILIKKKATIEKELEERINREKEEAEKKIHEIESELTEEKEALDKYKYILKDFENQKTDIKGQIKEHLDRATEFQTKIESMTGQTLKELKIVDELNQKLEELNHFVFEKVAFLKKSLEEKYGIVTEVPESNGHEDMGVDLRREMVKLKKIKELLEMPESIEEAPGIETTPAIETQEEESVQEESVQEEELEYEEIKEEAKEVEEIEEKEEVSPEREELKTEASEFISSEEPALEEKEVSMEIEEPEAERIERKQISFQEVFDELEKHRKSKDVEGNGEISYFEKEDKIILDGEFFVTKLDEYVEEARKLYIKLSQTESPKEQFFVKQEILYYQEFLRKLILSSVRMLEKESCSFPEYTNDILNEDVLKDILERVSMGNWSNQEDYESFDIFVQEFKNKYSARITPPDKYLSSILEELNML